MKLSDYLTARGETQRAFADRSTVPQQTLSRIIQGEGPRLDTAVRIVQASRSEPAPDGGTVRFEDLLEPTRRADENP